MTRQTLVRFALGAAALTLAAVGSCSSPTRPAMTVVGPSDAAGAPPPAAEPPRLVLSDEPWTFDTATGRVIRTPSYDLFTTMPRGMLVDRAPRFLERALIHYTTALGPLPRPRERLQTYLFGTRAQWATLTRRLLGNDAEPYLAIERGGFSYRARGVYHDIGPKDTLLIAAHEGWHQYVQSAFREGLPVWLDEGVATYMEGFRWSPDEPDVPLFLPWANMERYETLRWTVRGNRTMPLTKLLTSTPQELIERSEWQPLFYYAQVWALIHFLREGEGGKYASGLSAMIEDAAEGRMAGRINATLGPRAAQSFRARRDGIGPFGAYISKDFDAVDAEFKAFLQDLVQRGNRAKIVEGVSPVRPKANPTTPKGDGTAVPAK